MSLGRGEVHQELCRVEELYAADLVKAKAFPVAPGPVYTPMKVVKVAVAPGPTPPRASKKAPQAELSCTVRTYVRL